MYELYFNYPSILILAVVSIGDRHVLFRGFIEEVLWIFIPFE
jgi:hypothetical protein